MFSCFRHGFRGRSDHRGRGGAQCGRDNPPSEMGHHRQVPKQPPSETQIRHLRMWVTLELCEIQRESCEAEVWGARVRGIGMHSSRMFPVFIQSTIHIRWDVPANIDIPHLPFQPRFSAFVTRSVWWVGSSTSTDHPGYLRTSSASTARASFTSPRASVPRQGRMICKGIFYKYLSHHYLTNYWTFWTGLRGWAGVLGPERPLPRAVLCLHAAESLLAPAGGGPRAGQG